VISAKGGYHPERAKRTEGSHPGRAKRTEGSYAGLQRKARKAVHQGDPSTALGMTEVVMRMTVVPIGIKLKPVILKEPAILKECSEPKDLM
jgi:hypothetical protein